MKSTYHFLWLIALLLLPSIGRSAAIGAADLPKTNSLAATNYIWLVIGAPGQSNVTYLINLSNLVNQIVTQPNFIAAAGVTNVAIEQGTNMVVDTNMIGATTIYKISLDPAVTNNAATSNLIALLASNRVEVVAGSNIIVVASGNANGVMTYRVHSTGGGGGSASNAIVALNGLTAFQQFFATTATGGGDFNIISSGSNHLFLLPTASVSARGALSAADWALFNSKQPTNAVLTFLTQTGALTNQVAAGTNMVFTTNAGILTISGPSTILFGGINTNNLTTNGSILDLNSNITVTGTITGGSVISSSGVGRGILQLRDDTDTNSWNLMVTNVMASTNVNLILPRLPTAGLWYGVVLQETNLLLTFLPHGTGVLTNLNGVLGWNTGMIGGGGGGSGETNSFYVVTVATNALANEVVQSKVTNGSLQLRLKGALMPTFGYPDLDDGSNNLPRLLFDGSGPETCYWFFQLPDDYGSGGTITYPYTALAGGAAQTSMWFQVSMINHPGSAVTVDVNNYGAFSSNAVVHPGTAGFPSSFSLSCNLGAAVAGDFIKVVLNRDPTDDKDNHLGDVAIRPNPVFQYNRR